MFLKEIASQDKLIKTKLLARRKKKTNPQKSKTTKSNSFIDVFGGLSGYMNPDDQAVQ